MAEHLFKTVYFPQGRVRAGGSARVTVSLPAVCDGSRITEGFLRYAKGLSSRDLRLALGDPMLEDMEERARHEGRSLSNLCLLMLLQHYGPQSGLGSDNGTSADGQLLLPFVGRPERKNGLGLTFRDSLRQHVHGWYPYVEGFSAAYTRDAILRYHPRTVYDPFGGSGTTQLAASMLGIPSFYSEVNPFMAFVAETKVNAARWARQNLDDFRNVAEAFLKELTTDRLQALGGDIDLGPYHRAFPRRDFFVERDLRHLLAARDVAISVSERVPALRPILLLACAANAVASSNMTRRADLRRRRDDEYKTRVVDVATLVSNTTGRMLRDVAALPVNTEPMTRVSADCTDVPGQYTGAFDLALTSPPYLNGTNYFRNTKLELWLLGFIATESDLTGLRRSAICAGINTVSKHREEYEEFASVETVATELEGVARDRRIPRLVRHYFSDMKRMFAQVLRVLTQDGVFLLDIGDSRFYGVHVPTDDLLVEVAQEAGLTLEGQRVLAQRRSRDKTELRQVELVFRKPPGCPTRYRQDGQVKAPQPGSLAARLERFREALPYKTSPYTSRSWGHRLHSLCSYQGKMKPAIAHWLVREFVPEGGRVLDPLGGVGTIPFEAALAGHVAVSNDMNPLAAVVATAKLDPPTLGEAEEALAALSKCMEAVVLTDEDHAAAAFGLNGTVADYYHEDTLSEILCARRVFADQPSPCTRGAAFIWASLLHVLHGNRPYAVSRTSHPITPFHPKGDFEYRSLLDRVRGRVDRALRNPLPPSFLAGRGIEGDYRDLPERGLGTFDAIITSPPFLGMRFDRPNWLRLWFCGWTTADFHVRSLEFLDRQQTKDTSCYRSFFDVCRLLLAARGTLIMHVGRGRRDDLVGELRSMGAVAGFQLVGEAVENVQSVEQHGIRDKGRRTTDHYLLFFTPS